MKVLQKILFTCAVMIGLSIAVFAQKDDQKKPPKKDPPPVVTPGNKPPPKKDDKPKKQMAEAILPSKESLVDLV